jgi:hypothetical protein
VPEERDAAQRIGDSLYPLVVRLRESRLSWIAVIALFGITLPIVLLRQRFDVRLRVILALIVFGSWVQLVRGLL